MLERYNRTTRIIIAIALAILIWVVGVIIGQEQTVTILNPEGGFKSIITRARNISVSLMIDEGNGNVKVLSDNGFIYGRTVMDLLQKFKNQEELSLDYAQDKLSGEIAGFTLNNLISGKQGGFLWLIWVNHQLQTEQADKIKLKANDYVELKYINLR